MPENVYRDLTPGLVNVPASTWAKSTPEGVRALMEEFSSATSPSELSTRALAASVRMQPVAGEARVLLEELAPEILEEFDRTVIIND